MVCKEDVVTWFKESSSYKRIDLMCSLLNMCLPFELRFLGTCVEDLGKRDFHDLREAENRANNLTVLSELQSVSDNRTRRSVAIFLSLLHSSNHGCSNELYRILSSFDDSEINNISGSNSESELDDHPLDELLLLYTMALNHPAFTYEQKIVFEGILLKLQEEENKLCLSNNVVIYVKSPVQVGEMDPALLSCSANQYMYVQPSVTAIAAIPVACAPDRKVCNQSNSSHEAANGTQASITRNGPNSSPQPMFLSYGRPGRYPVQQHTRQHHSEDAPLQVNSNCRSVPSPTPSPTHSLHPSDEPTVQIACVNPQPSTPPPTLNSSPTVVSARVNRRRSQSSSSPGVVDGVEWEMAVSRAPRGHRGGGGNGQRRTSPRRHQVRGRGGLEQRGEMKEIPRYGVPLGDTDEGPEESSAVDPDALEGQQNAEPSEAQHITNCLGPSVPAPSLPLGDAASKGNDAGHLNSSSPPITAPQLDEAPLAKGRLCALDEGEGGNVTDSRPQQPHGGESRPEVSPDDEVTVQSMQWVRATPGTTAMPPRQPCLPHTRPSLQRATFSGTNFSAPASGARSEPSVAPVPSSPSSSSLSSSSSSSSSGVSPQPPPPPTSSVPFSPPPQVPPPFLAPHLMPPPHTIRFPATTFTTTGFLSTSGGSAAGSGGGGAAPPPPPVGGTTGSYLTPGGPPVRHSFAFAPNGLAPAEIMYAATPTPPPPQYHTGHHPRVGGGPPVLDHSAPPILQQAGYPYIPVLLTSRAKGNTCYNCGRGAHRGGDCRELTMEEIIRTGSYRLEYSRQKGGALVTGVSGGGSGRTSGGGGGDNAGVVDE